MPTYEVQPKDADLDAIALLVTTSFGRALVAVSNLAELRTILGPTGTPGSGTYLRGDGTWSAPPGGTGGAVDSVNGQTGAVSLTAANVGAQPVDSDLTAIAALTTTSFGRAFLALADAAAGRTALGLGSAATTASTAYDAAGAAAAAQAAAIAASQPVDADLTAIAALTTTSVGRSLLAAADAAAIRTIAGAQASDTDLTAIAALTSAADKTPYATGAGTWALADFGSFARGLLALTTSSAVRTYLGVVIGTNVQAWDADLDAIAALTTTSYGRAFLTLADAAALRAVLGTGTPSGSNFLRGDGTWAAPSASGSVATDAVWDAKGDLAVGTAADTAQKLTAGANNTFLVADSAQTTGLKWADATTSRTALGLGTAATAATGDFQPNDADLTAIAALSTTSFGRGLLAMADAAAGRTALGVVPGVDVQPLDSDLTAIAALATTSYGRSLLTVADASAARTYVGVEAHIQETDPFVHNAPKIAYSGTVSAADVAEAIDTLDATKADAASVDTVDARVDSLLNGTAAWFVDDFRWSRDATVSGSIGERDWLSWGGTTSVGSQFGTTSWPQNPGGIRISTGVTANTWAGIRKADVFATSAAQWQVEFIALPIVVSSNVTLRCGVSEDPTSETPSNAVFLQKLTTDSTVWNLVTRTAGTEVITATTVNLPGNTIPFRVRMWKSSSTQVSVQVSTGGGAFSSAQAVTFNPAATLVDPFIGIKNSTTTSRNLEVDFASVYMESLTRT